MGLDPRRHAVMRPTPPASALRAALLGALLVYAGCGAGVQDAARAPVPAAAADLESAERLGGHTLARHVGRTDDDLRARLRREPGIAAASTYTDLATAERVVAATLARFTRRVQAWSAREGPRPNLTLDYRGDAGTIVGRSLRRGNTRVRDCADAVVVLRWHASGRSYVLTSYPECRQ